MQRQKTKGMRFDTTEGFYIYKEGTYHNELNYKHNLCSKKTFKSIINKGKHRYNIPTLPLYIFSFSHSLTPTIPPPSLPLILSYIRPLCRRVR